MFDRKLKTIRQFDQIRLVGFDPSFRCFVHGSLCPYDRNCLHPRAFIFRLEPKQGIESHGINLSMRISFGHHRRNGLHGGTPAGTFLMVGQRLTKAPGPEVPERKWLKITDLHFFFVGFRIECNERILVWIHMILICWNQAMCIFKNRQFLGQCCLKHQISQVWAGLILLIFCDSEQFDRGDSLVAFCFEGRYIHHPILFNFRRPDDIRVFQETRIGR